MKGRRFIASSLLVSVLATSLLSGCGSSAPSETDQPSSADVQVSAASDAVSTASNTDPSDAQGDGASNTDSEVQNVEKSDPADLNEQISYTYQSHPVALVHEDDTLVTSNYYTFDLDKSDQARYPKLKEALDNYSAEDETEATEFLGDNEVEVLQNFANEIGIGYERGINLYPSRSDGRVFSFYKEVNTYLGGAHGYVFYKGYNFDPATGKEILFSDVIKDTDALPNAIYKELIRQNDDLFDFFNDDPSYRDQLLDGMPERFEDNSKGLPWAIDYDGVWFCFEDYAMGVYVAGSRVVKVPFADHPDIFVPGWDSYAGADKIPETGAGSKELKDAEIAETVSSGVYLEEEEGEDWWHHAIVENPGWSAWTASDIDTTAGEPEFKFERVSEKSSSWLDCEQWASEKGISLPGFATDPYYYEGGYSFSRTDDAENGTLDLVVMTEGDDPTVIGDFYFDEFLNPPDQGTDMFAQFTTPGIFYAAMKDNVLYVALGHRTYAASNPHKAYIIAIDTVTGNTLWKSDDQVSGAGNFIIRGDSIICGYGFTDEPDYIYILNRKNGKTQKKIKVRSAPEYFIPDGEDKLYVLTYDTEYLYTY